MRRDRGGGGEEWKGNATTGKTNRGRGKREELIEKMSNAGVHVWAEERQRVKNLQTSGIMNKTDVEEPPFGSPCVYSPPMLPPSFRNINNRHIKDEDEEGGKK